MQLDDEPRLIEWTGERCVPWGDDVQVVYEHLHRYYFAAEFATGKDVVDIGSGEGYGSAYLGSHAASVVGLDIDQGAVAHARERYEVENVHFIQGSALTLESYFGKNSFDLAVCFEVLEHVTEHQRLLDGIRHVLRDDGMLVLSTPDRDLYRESLTAPNPFHKRELTREELVQILSKRFQHAALWAQTGMAGSYARRLSGSPSPHSRQEFFIEARGGSWNQVPEPHLHYTVVVAANVPIPPEKLPTVSCLFDPKLEIARRLQHRIDVISEERRASEEARAELEHIKLTQDDEATKRLTALEQALQAVTTRERDFRQAVFDMNAELLRKDAEQATVQAALDERHALLVRTEGELAVARPLAVEYERIITTRAFGLIRLWWRVKAFLFRR